MERGASVIADHEQIRAIDQVHRLLLAEPVEPAGAPQPQRRADIDVVWLGPGGVLILEGKAAVGRRLDLVAQRLCCSNLRDGSGQRAAGFSTVRWQ